MEHVVCHFEIPAEDPEALGRFYSELLGWKVEPMPGDPEYWGITTGGSGPEGGLMRKQCAEHTPMNYVSVECVDTFARQAEALGAQVVMGKTEVPGMGWFVVLLDPQGNAIGLWECAANA